MRRARQRTSRYEGQDHGRVGHNEIAGRSDMSQNQTKGKTKIEPTMESVIQVKLPMVRNFSTGGGHGPEDTLVEGDQKVVTKKWQGYPPANLNVVGKPMPPLPEVAIPRFTGKAD